VSRSTASYKLQATSYKLEHHLVQALAVNRDLGYRFGEALCLTNLGYAYEASGRFQEALAAYEEGLAIRVRHCSLNDQAASLHSIGALLITMERVDDAMDYLHRSLKICQDNNIGYGQGLTLASLGDGYLALGKPADAHAAWRQAHDILAEIGATEAPAVRERLATLALPVQAQPENRTKAVSPRSHPTRSASAGAGIVESTCKSSRIRRSNASRGSGCSNACGPIAG
jgi:tetratricopeptide (TPR) repeat protein